MDTGSTLQHTLQDAYQYGKQFVKDGSLASYIPELLKADQTSLGVCVALPDGTYYSCGDVTTAFTMQSISKILTLMFALEHYGADEVFSKVGMEPTGDPFNSIMKLEMKNEKPYNPMINAGAIVTTGFIQEHDAFDDMFEFIKRLADTPNVVVDEAVYRSEIAHGSRNRSLAYLLSSKGLLGDEVDKCLELYFRLCSISVTAAQLARIGLILSLDGKDPKNGQPHIQPWVAQMTKTLMLTCGMYDGSGEFALRVGIPSKSGVGGGILSCVNQRCGIGVYGPSLDAKGNSIGGLKLLEHFSRQMDFHLFPLKVSKNNA